MKPINKEILEIADQAFLDILSRKDILIIKHKFSLKNSWYWFHYLCLIAGLFILATYFFNNSRENLTNFHLVLGLLFTLYSTLALLIKYSDEVVIENKIIKIQYNLKRSVFYLSSEKKIIMKTKVIKANPFTGVYGYDYFNITHFIQDKNTEIPIFCFEMINEKAEIAIKLANQLTQLINEKKNDL